jgi:hypothetical protein
VSNWAPASWNTVGDHGTLQRTPDVRAIVQEIVSLPGWTSGRPLALIVTGTGRRTSCAYDGTPGGAPLLHVAYQVSGGPTTTTTTTIPPTTTTTVATLPATTTTTTLPSGTQTIDVRVAASDDDAEEQVSNGAMDVESSDLELVTESAVQLVGMRFRNVTVPRNATIVAAWIRFQVDEVSTGSAALRIQGQVGDALPFGTAARNISNRPRTVAFRDWSPAGWSQVGVVQQSADIAAVVQEVVNGSGWSSGRAMGLIVTGSGKRVAEAFDGVPAAAPLLHIEYR